MQDQNAGCVGTYCLLDRVGVDICLSDYDVSMTSKYPHEAQQPRSLLV